MSLSFIITRSSDVIWNRAGHGVMTVIFTDRLDSGLKWTGPDAASSVVLVLRLIKAETCCPRVGHVP